MPVSNHTRQSCLMCVPVLVAAMAANPRDTAAQLGCTPEDTVTTAWIQGVMDEPIMADARAHLGLAHLEGYAVTFLRSEAGDDATCGAILGALTTEERARLEASTDSYQILFYRVGDRYLLVWDPRPESLSEGQLGPSVVISFDSQFTEIDAVMW